MRNEIGYFTGDATDLATSNVNMNYTEFKIIRLVRLASLSLALSIVMLYSLFFFALTSAGIESVFVAFPWVIGLISAFYFFQIGRLLIFWLRHGSPNLQGATIAAILIYIFYCGSIIVLGACASFIFIMQTFFPPASILDGGALKFALLIGLISLPLSIFGKFPDAGPTREL